MWHVKDRNPLTDKFKPDRRQFLKATALSTVSLAVPATLITPRDFGSQNHRIPFVSATLPGSDEGKPILNPNNIVF